jgi:hypothetical protein
LLCELSLKLCVLCVEAVSSVLHTRAADVLAYALGQNPRHAPQINRLRTILQAKSDASYSGTYYTLDDGKRIVRLTTEFIRWAEEMMAARPGWSS